MFVSMLQEMKQMQRMSDLDALLDDVGEAYMDRRYAQNYYAETPLLRDAQNNLDAAKQAVLDWFA